MDNPKKRTPQASKNAKLSSETKKAIPKQIKRSKKRYDQVVFRDWCKACGICSAFCPKKVIGCDDAGEPVVVRPDDCIGCRFCELHCPDFAITIIDRDEGEERIRHGS